MTAVAFVAAVAVLTAGCTSGQEFVDQTVGGLSQQAANQVLSTSVEGMLAAANAQRATFPDPSGEVTTMALRTAADALSGTGSYEVQFSGTKGEPAAEVRFTLNGACAQAEVAFNRELDRFVVSDPVKPCAVEPAAPSATPSS